MKSKTLALTLIILSLILVQTASASAPIKDIITLGETTATGKGRIVPNYGYYVYGEVSNTQLYNIKNVIVEVTTYDQSDAVIDTQTAMVRPTRIDAGTKAPFLVISTKPPQVYREEIKIKSYERTEESNFPYIELTDISEVFNGGVTGTVSNTHPNINLYEAEIIATFYNYNGEIWDIQSYGVNNYAQFNAGDTEDFTIQSDLLTSYTVNLVTQCNMYYREPTLEMTFSNDTPVKDQQMTLNFTVYPNLPGQPIDVTVITYGDQANTVPINMYSDSTYTMTIMASYEGLWTVRMTMLPTLVNQSRGYIEEAQIEKTYTVMKAPEVTPPSTDDTTGEDTGSSGIDVEIKTLTDSIPGFPVASILVALTASALLHYRRD